MYYRLYIVFAILFLAGCSGNKKGGTNSTDTFSVHKVWVFDTVKSLPKNFGPFRLGRHTIDMTNTDTLRLSYGIHNNAPSSYPYKIIKDSIFVQNRLSYKILKLTASELDLVSAFKDNNTSRAKTDSIVLVYKAK